ncbi:SNF2 family N-terminal domain-containing protein [Fimicolochytrium jonesii]|uniref:SNF2 family N-terminal domain-containing protein n=1 Tax=Fimicolochytrium jonesii TaxID=1396493 RepID=UPI0022FDBEC8|nr:SNF2 family N-terminal domain-containing protein [Fimicolochytrium jonesii]KAI8823675.1 SNF2 family N-terminal domain-containing protein [Fimicolochytrium jonesii]
MFPALASSTAPGASAQGQQHPQLQQQQQLLQQPQLPFNNAGFAARPIQSPSQHQPYQQLPHRMSGDVTAQAPLLPHISSDQLRDLITKARVLKEKGATENNDPEFGRIMAILRQYQNSATAQASAHAATHPPQQPYQQPSLPPPTTADNTRDVTGAAPMDADGDGSQTAVSGQAAGPFTQEQLTALRCQIYVFKLISSNKPVPEHLRRLVFNPDGLRPPEPKPELHPIPQTIIEASHKLGQALAQQPTSQPPAVTKAVATRFELGPFSTPQSVLPKKITMADLQQRLVIPSGTPSGIDPHALIQEREKKIKARIQYRIHELESLPSNLASDTGAKIQALIELKALKLLDKQKKLRSEILQSLGKATTLATAVDRGAYRRVKKQSLREAKQTEKLEKNQRLEREKRDKQKHQDYLLSILQHGRDLVGFHKQQQTKGIRLGQAVSRFHANAQKEEEKRQQRLSQERLNALKANDEATYLKLVDKVKNNRIMHLLNQTESYLTSLTKAMHDQKASVHDYEVTHHNTQGEDAGDNDYYNTAHRIQETVTEQPELLVGGKLKDYQLKGLQWMVSLYNNRLNGILADEMGLGKTIQTLSLITYLMEKKKQLGPYLVIVPLSTITNWELEFERWAPKVNKIVFKGTAPERAKVRNDIKSGNFNVVVTTYEYVIREKAVLSKIKWVYMIIDEGHRMKNTQSKLSMTLARHYITRYRLILTGTPLQNDLPELWALLNFILPKIFSSVDTFDDWFNHPFAKEGGKENDIRLNEEESLLIIRGLHKVLRPFLLRRLKKDVESELPDKVETVVKCPMSALQHRLYEQIRNKRSSFGGDGEKRKKALNNLVMQFRKVCNHPYVFEEVEHTMNPYGMTDNNLWRVAGKFELLDRILPKYKVTGHRVLMFFQMTQVMDIMEDYLRFRAHAYLRLDGHTKAEDRTTMLKAFNSKEDPEPPFIFLLSTRAGGLGLNLQTADTVIIFDSDWNPHQDLQAQDRAHRIGQTKEVRILRLITARSVEETILARAQYKLDMDGKVIQAGKFDNKTTDRERDELLRSLFGGDEDEEDKDEGEGQLEDTDLNEIIARDESELELFNKMDADRVQKEKEIWRAAGQRGDPPPRLIPDSELPDAFKIVDEVITGDQALEVFGRGARARKDIRYDDGLNDDQYVAALEDGDVEGYIEKRRAAKAKREERKRLRESRTEDGSDDDGSDEDDEDGTAGKSLPEPQAEKTPTKRRSRPTKKAEDEPLDDVPDISTGRKARRGKVKDENEDTPVVKRGRKKKFAGVDENEVDPLPPARRRALRRIFGECYKAVENSEVEYDNGMTRLRCDLFRELPARAHYPDYYQLIKSPIAMDMISHRMNHAYYKTLDQFVADFHLMFANAMLYNVEGSEVYEDAVQMKFALDTRVQELAPGGQIIITEQDQEPPSNKRKHSMMSAASDNDDDAGPSNSGRGSKSSRNKRSSVTNASDAEGDDSIRRPKKKKRDLGVPGISNKYGSLPKIRMRLPAPPPQVDPSIEDGEIPE